MYETTLRALREQVQRISEAAGLPGGQYAVALEGELIAFESFGAAAAANRFCIFSAAKPIFSSLVWQMIGTGELDLNIRVSEIWPEFA